jgi:tyrosine-protein phosphatase YwqE
MDELTNDELQESLNDLRGTLVAKKQSLMKTPKHLLPKLVEEIKQINEKINELKAEAKKRGIELS